MEHMFSFRLSGVSQRGLVDFSDVHSEGTMSHRLTDTFV